MYPRKMYPGNIHVLLILIQQQYVYFKHSGMLYYTPGESRTAVRLLLYCYYAIILFISNK